METNWKKESGFDIHSYGLTISMIDSSKIRVEQQAKIEKISLVSFLNEHQRKTFANICRRIKRNDNSFYQNKNLHVTLCGFGPLEKEIYEQIQRKVQEFIEQHPIKELKIKFDCVRPGAMYTGDKTLRTVKHLGNGTVIAYGDVLSNRDFYNYTNKLTIFLLNDKKIKSKIGVNFRRKFPAVWCTLGYYDKKECFKICDTLDQIFNQYSLLSSNGDFNFPVSEIALVKSKYKNLRYSQLIQNYTP
jgi:hypothetical protein